MIRRIKPTPACREVGSFSSYALSRRAGIGTTHVPYSKMSRVINPHAAASTHRTINLGFTFYFNGDSYNTIQASSTGWIILGSADHAGFMTSATGDEPATIRPVIAAAGALVCPWFMWGAGPTEQSMPTYGPLMGVYYCREKSAEGVRGIVRWVVSNRTIIGVPQQSNVVLTFECVLYESTGKIEFRYTPVDYVPEYCAPYVEIASHGGACGVWTTGTNTFRDFTRDNCVYGGAVYNAAFSYTEGGGAVKTYAYNRRTQDTWDAVLAQQIYSTWPGDAIYIFEPTQALRRNLPRRDLQSADSVTRAVSNHVFNDQATLIYGTSSLSTTPVSCSYPTTLPSGYFGRSGPSPRQFSDTQSSIVATSIGGVTKPADYWLQEGILGQQPGVDTAAPFDESTMFEQASSIKSTNFYMTGSSASDYMPGYSQNIGAKEIIRLRFPILSETLLRPLTSSIYYYDVKQKAILEYGTAPRIDPGGEYFPGAMADAVGFTPLGTVASNIRQYDFDRYFHKVQWTDTHTVSHPRCAPGFGLEYANNRRQEGVMEFNEGILNMTSSYSVAVSGTIKLSDVLDRQFLVEKVMINLPLAAGPGWTLDRTRTKRMCGFDDYFVVHPGLRQNATEGSLCSVVADWPLDVGGPCITVGLMNQFMIANFPGGTPSYRDLIVTGTIIPINDNVSTINFEESQYITINELGGASVTLRSYSITQEGFKSFMIDPSTTITPNAAGFFSGSAFLELNVVTSNGYVLFPQVMTGPKELSRVFTYGDVMGTDQTPFLQGHYYWQNLTNNMIMVVNDSAGSTLTPAVPYLGPYGNEYVNLGPSRDNFPTTGIYNPVSGERIISTNPLGRSNTGKWTSGRSIRDMVGVDGQPVQSVLYPFNDQILAHMAATYALYGSWVTGDGISFEQSKVQYFPDVATVVESTQYAPYLLDPKDQLIFFVSKHRPVKSGSLSHLYSELGEMGSGSKPGDIADVFPIARLYSALTGSHDVRIISGTLEIVLIGSYVQEGIEHDYAGIYHR